MRCDTCSCKADAAAAIEAYLANHADKRLIEAAKETVQIANGEAEYTTLLRKLEASEREIARLTDPAYLATAIERVGMVDAEWKASAEKLAAALKPFVVGDAAMEEILWGHLPDDATGTVTVKLADFRRARSALASIASQRARVSGTLG